MHLTRRLYKQHLGWHTKKLWEQRMARPQPVLNVADILKDKDVIDPLVAWEPEKVRWRPPVEDPSWIDPENPIDTLKMSADWNEEPTYVMSTLVRMMQGVKQAALMCKCKIHDGLPPRVSSLISDEPRIKDQDLLVQRIILQSHKWEPSAVKLPKRLDPEKWHFTFPREFGIPDKQSKEMLVRGLVRLCDTLHPQYPGLLTQRRQTPRGFISYQTTSFTTTFQTNNSLCIYFLREMLVRGLVRLCDTLHPQYPGLLTQRRLHPEALYQTTSFKTTFQANISLCISFLREMLVRGLVRLCDTLHPQYPDLLTKRRQTPRSFISSNYLFQDDKRIVIQGQMNRVITSDTPLLPFADEDEVDQTAMEKLPDMWPVSPTIDFLYQNMYTLKNNTGFKADYPHGHIHTIFVDASDRWNSDQTSAMGLMYALGACVAQARQLYGADVSTLPRPISIQCITVNSTSFNFLFFQLNTLNFTSTDGVKNVAWIDKDSHLYRKTLRKPWKRKVDLRFLETQYDDYDGGVFNKFMGVYLNGVSDIGR